uniref:Synaptotagmin like 1 n=1 Tax=Varanus komodoensis TaxID=61221 RepID=A0A8D2JCN8_VARKO
MLSSPDFLWNHIPLCAPPLLPSFSSLWPLFGPALPMDVDISMDALLDLSFLTEEEQNAIAEVLQRDSQLRMLEEGRISKLRESVSDPNYLKFLSGDWFCDVRSKRHWHNHFGSDIVRASIRRKRKPKGKRQTLPGDSAPSSTAISACNSLQFEVHQVDPNAPLPHCRTVKISSLPPPVFYLQSNGSLGNGQEGALSLTPPKNNAMRPRKKLLSASSSFSSLSSSTMSGSMMSVFSDNDIGNVEVRGCIQFSLQYDSMRKELHIQVIQCRDLAEAKKQRSDPYVKTYLLPDKSNHSKRKTVVKKKTLDPIFNETLKVRRERLPSLVVTSIHVAFFAEKGLPPTGELHIWIKEAQNVVPRRGGTADCFVQCYILPDDSKRSRQKTRIVKKSLSPIFNHTMVYDGFQAKDLAEACAEFTVWDQETFSKQRLGGIRLSLGTGNSYGLPVPWMDSTEEERHVWEMVFANPQQWVEAGLPLRTDLSPRT